MMKSIVSTLLVLATALLLSSPSQAGYADGMNQYAAYHVMHGGVDPMGLWTLALDKGEHVWCAEKGDTLQSLAAREEYGGNSNNWACLWPVGDTQDNGYLNGDVAAGDLYDASNIATPTPNETRVAINVAWDLRRGYNANYDLDGYMQPWLVAQHLATVSGEGATPIYELIIAGHSGTNGMSGHKKGEDEGPFFRFTVDDLLELDKPPSFERAKSKKGPVRCWFTRDCDARFPGCNSADVMAKPFAEKILRVGAISHGTTFTTKYLRTGGVRWTNQRKLQDGGRGYKWIYDPDNFTKTCDAAPFWEYYSGKQ